MIDSSYDARILDGGMLNHLVDRFLDLLPPPYSGIVLISLIAGLVWWYVAAATSKHKEKVRCRRTLGILVIGLLAICIGFVTYFVFQREPGFSKNSSGILVMQFTGDEKNSLQGDLVEKLNAELQSEAPGQRIEVHAGHEKVDEGNGLTAAHARARKIGQRVNATLVIWGRTITENKFYPRITVAAPPEHWGAAGERTHDAQIIKEYQLPAEVVEEPFYLIHFAAGYSYYVRGTYNEALSHFESALGRKGASQDELADLQFVTAHCDQLLAGTSKNRAARLTEAIEHYENAAKLYEGRNRENWAATQNNLGNTYENLGTEDRGENAQSCFGKGYDFKASTGRGGRVLFDGLPYDHWNVKIGFSV